MAKQNASECLKSQAEDAPEARAWSVPDFARIHGIGRTLAFEEIKDGRLTARRVKGRTIIIDEDAAAWRTNLPKVHDESSAA